MTVVWGWTTVAFTWYVFIGASTTVIVAWLRRTRLAPAGAAASRMTRSTPRARRVIEDAIARGVFPAAAVEVGSSGASMWTRARSAR